MKQNPEKRHRLFLPFFSLMLCFGLCACAAPREDSGAYDTAVAALEKEEYQEAVSAFQESADTDGRLAEAPRGEGIAFFEQGDYKHAVMLFDMSLNNMKYENEDFSEDVLFYKAESLVRDNRSEEALAVYKELMDQECSLAYALAGQIALTDGDAGRAQEYFDKSLEAGTDIEICLLIYEAYQSVNREGDGAVYLKKALEVTPSSGEDYVRLGKIYDYLEDYPNAVSCLNRAIDSGVTEAVAVLGNIYLKENDLSGAKALYTDALRKGNDIAMAYNGLAMCALAEGNYESALNYVKMGLDCGDEEADRSLLFNEITAYEKMLDFETAKQKCEAYLERYPTDEAARREYKFLTHGD